MSGIIAKVLDFCTEMGGKIIGAIVVFIIGNMIIKAVKKGLENAEKKINLEKTVQNVLKNIIVILLYAILVICVISILGIPVASVIAVLASCGLAIGLSLQGALSNLAGGIMILVFKPFRVGDYVEISGTEGTVVDISIFYTAILTNDNRRISIPNGDLMNSKVSNYTCEEFRRVDIDFKVTNDCDHEFAKQVILKAVEATTGVESDPAPFTRMTSLDDDAFVFQVRAWCKTELYWDVYFDILENCTNALGENGIDDPEQRLAVRLVKSED